MSKQFSRNSKILSLETISSPIRVEDSDMWRAFERKKKSVMAYRVLFLAFGILFTALTAILFIKTPNWNYSVIFGYGWTLKTLLSIVTCSFAFAALWLGCYMRTEHELTKEFHQDAKNRLNRAFMRKTSLSCNSAISQETQQRLYFMDAFQKIEFSYQEADAELDALHLPLSYPESFKKVMKLEILSRFKQNLELIVVAIDHA